MVGGVRQSKSLHSRLRVDELAASRLLTPTRPVSARSTHGQLGIYPIDQRFISLWHRRVATADQVTARRASLEVTSMRHRQADEHALNDIRGAERFGETGGILSGFLSRWRRRPLRVAVVAAIAIIVPVASVAAHLASPWYSTTESAYIYTNETTWTTGDSIRTRVTSMDWSSTAASNMRHMATHGARFTLNFADLNNNLSATVRYTTSLPNPYYDRDLSGSKCGEAEITSESSTFPSATSTYFGNVWFTRWYWIGGGTGWAWNNAGGNIEYGEQLSLQYGLGDKWDAATPTYGGGALAYIDTHVPYGAKARPASNPPSSADPCQYDSGPLRVPASAPAPQELAGEFDVIPGDEPGQVTVRADLSRGTDAYAASARELAMALTGTGTATGTLTFSRPVNAEILSQLSDTGITFVEIEAVSAPLANGNRMTFGDAYHPDVWTLMDELASEEGAEMLGVVSAVVTVPNPGVLRRAERHPDVYVVDLAAEQVRRAHPEVTNVAANDLYWYLAGWDAR